MAAEVPRLVVITDWSLGAEVLLERLERALGAGPGIAVQHRHPDATARAFFDEGVRLRALCERFAAPLFVSRRLDVALALGASLHLPAYGLLPADVSPRVTVSVAVHDLDEARRAHGAAFALVSPVFEKGTATVLGVDGFERLARELPCPALALGGVTPLRRVASAAGHAVISAVLRADDPRDAAAKLLAP